MPLLQYKPACLFYGKRATRSKVDFRSNAFFASETLNARAVKNTLAPILKNDVHVMIRLKVSFTCPSGCVSVPLGPFTACLTSANVTLCSVVSVRNVLHLPLALHRVFALMGVRKGEGERKRE